VAVMTKSVRRYSLSGVIVENSEVAAADIMLRSVPSMIYLFLFLLSLLLLLFVYNTLLNFLPHR
jgi:hypothetical protein